MILDGVLKTVTGILNISLIKLQYVIPASWRFAKRFLKIMGYE